MNAKAVREAENFPGMEIRLNVLVIEFSLGLIWGKDVDPVGAFRSLVRSNDDHTIRLGLLGALAIGIETDDDFVSAVAEILGLGVSLAAVAEDGDRLALQRFGLGIAFIENCDHQRAPLICKGERSTNLGVDLKTDRSVGIWKCYSDAGAVSSLKHLCTPAKLRWQEGVSSISAPNT